MIKILGKIPMEVNIAFSGGVDSMAAAHFLMRGGRKVNLLHFDHGCEYSAEIKQQCVKFANMFNMSWTVFTGNSDKPAGMSLEEYWRRQRYRALRQYISTVGDKFITCHHLDDAVETWVWSSLHGQPKIIPYSDDGLYRPFLTTEKQSFVDYAKVHNLPVVDDPYNDDTSKMRNYMRVHMMQHAYHINPGLKKVIRKKYLELVKD